MEQYQEQSDVATVGTADRLFSYMVGRARFRDRLYFAADSTAARELGVCRLTIIRARKRLEADGRIVRSERRIGRAVVYSFPVGARRTPRRKPCVTQRSTSRRSRTNTPRFARGGGSAALPTWKLYRKRPSMEHLPGLEPEPRPIRANDVMAAFIDIMRLDGIPVIPRARGMIAKASKELLEADFNADVVLTAAVVSLQRGEPHLMDMIAQDIVVAQAGKRMTREGYREVLNRASAALKPPTRGEELARVAYAKRRKTC